MKKNVVPYTKARDQLPTFTIINCEHKDLFWRLIGHTAILYKCPLTGQLSVFESTTLNKFTGKSGVQLTPFGTWLAHYPGKVFARVPKFGDSGEEAGIERQVMAEMFIKQYIGTSYPDLKTWSGRLKLALSALDFRLFGRDWLTYKGKDDGIYCTMLVIKKLQGCGLFDGLLKSSEFEPDDTRGNKKIFESNLINTVYQDEIRLK